MRSMNKRVFMLLFFVCILAAVLAGCNGEGASNGYFKSFSSSKGFSSAEEGLTLPAGVEIYSYDADDDVFITDRTVINVEDNSSTMLFGLCGFDETYVDPIYSSIESIRGDIAVVRKMAVDETTAVSMLGVIKFRGKERGELTEFSPAEATEHLFRFVGDYLAVSGTKDLASSQYRFTTFYDYSQGVLLEAFRIKHGMEYTYQAYDDYVVAVGDDHAYFYEKGYNIGGYLEPFTPAGKDTQYGYYLPFPEDTEREFAAYLKLDIFYLGNGWFSRTAQLRSEEVFEGYQMVYTDMDASSYTVESKTYYANVRCDFYNARTHETREGDWLIVRDVANKYHAEYYSEMATYLNNLSTYDETLEAYEYHLPYMDPSASIQDGYSIVYYYYLPYVNLTNLPTEKRYLAETSFCVVDQKLLVDRLESAEILMPPVYVDGYGIPTSDPFFEPYFGSVYVYDTALRRTELVPYREGKKTYQTFLYNDGGIVAQELDYDETTGKYGMVSPSGERILDFRYDALSPYFGEYAIGVLENVFVRIDREGQETILNGVVNVRQAVYVYTEEGKLGLKNYAGEDLVMTNCDELYVVEAVLTDDTFLTSFVVAKRGNEITLYRLRG